jgi:hypothetical protein
MRLVESLQTNSPHMNHSTNTVPIIIPASLNMATLFPLAAIRPSLPAEPFRLVLMEENVSDYFMSATTLRSPISLGEWHWKESLQYYQ